METAGTSKADRPVSKIESLLDEAEGIVGDIQGMLGTAESVLETVKRPSSAVGPAIEPKSEFPPPAPAVSPLGIRIGGLVDRLKKLRDRASRIVIDVEI